MKKVWRNPRQVNIHQAPAEPEDAQRLERLISLLATGVERLLSKDANNNSPKKVDFQADVLVNVDTLNETSKLESK